MSDEELFARLRELIESPEVIERAHEVGLALATDTSEQDKEWMLGGGAITYGMLTAGFDAAVERFRAND